MARVIMSWHTASVSGKLSGFREVTRFLKMNSFLLAIDPSGNVDQRRTWLQGLVERPHDLEKNFVQVRACQSQSHLQMNHKALKF